jgi:exopolysaccharide production protein ExoQ
MATAYTTRMADSKTRLGLSAYAGTVFFVTLGGNGVRNALGWPGFLAVGVVLLGIGLWLMIARTPARFRWYRVPAPLTLFLALALVSVAWSAYRPETLLGTLAQLATTTLAVALAFLLSWHEVLRTLGTALRFLLGLSLLFELWVAVFIRQPLLPWWMPAPEGKIPKLLFWSRDLLFDGGPIQGLVASSVLLGFLGLLGAIVFAVQLRAGLVRTVVGWFWLGIALLTLALTRGATVTVALLAVVVVLGFAIWARRVGPAGRVPLYATGTALIALSAVGVLFARDFLFGMLGKSGDLTGRLETWQKVTELAEQKPWFGWGWVSYWAPWAKPFKSLDTKAGIQVMSAHNAWLDVWLQLGIVGLLLFAILIFVTIWRVWFRAIDQPRRGFGPPLPYATSALFPFLIVVALLVQSLTESRILVEGGWLLLVLFLVKSKTDYEVPSRLGELQALPWSRVPISHGTPSEMSK